MIYLKICMKSSRNVKQVETNEYNENFNKRLKIREEHSTSVDEFNSTYKNVSTFWQIQGKHSL